MKSRVPTNPAADKNIFTETATKVKAINLPIRVYRGGIRL